MLDRFSGAADTPSSPALRALAITPSDTAALPSIAKAVYVGIGGDITMRGMADTADTLWRNVPDGAILPFRASYIRATGTTASAILLLG